MMTGQADWEAGMAAKGLHEGTLTHALAVASHNQTHGAQHHQESRA
jgi:hypothetical protein